MAGCCFYQLIDQGIAVLRASFIQIGEVNADSPSMQTLHLPFFFFFHEDGLASQWV